MKIKQITACMLPDCYKWPSIVYGLGDDGNVYYWNTKTGEWKIDQQKSEETYDRHQ